MTIDFGVLIELCITQGVWKAGIALSGFQHSGGVNRNKTAC